MDKARMWTDKELKKMEREITKIYQKASHDLYIKFDKYMARAEKVVESLEVELELAQSLGKDTSGIEKALIDKKKAITFQTHRYRGMIEDITTELANVNQTAVAYIQGELPEIYRVNYNQKPVGLRGMRFDIVTKEVVAKRIITGDIILPKKKIIISKDVRWNTKYLNSQVLQGILQGEDMRKIAKRIFPEIMAKSPKKGLTEKEMKGLIKRNKQAAIRNARTMVTGAENVGRLDRYKNLEGKGVILTKIWMSAHDGRVRDWHADIDGQEVGIHDEFVDGLGNELEYPGDPGAPGETVYNCRCSMRSHIIGFKKEWGVEYV